ncbi:MAG: hypothetical protein QOJ99_954 [Bryobacterales bacterium]|nr:hypothetical protein [Bryobacterales bacterium]
MSIFLAFCLAICLCLLLTKGNQYAKYFGGGAAGLGGGSALEALRRVWKDWSRTDLLIFLIPDMTEPQLAAIINKLIKNL